MNRSLRLFGVGGIDIRIHVTFPLILLWAAFQFGMLTGTWSGALFGVIAISFLFVLVTLHELGHSFAAISFGVPVEQIVLTPIGGVAQLKNMPDRPLEEFVIALAGPAVNFVFAVLMGVAAIFLRIDLLDLGVLLGGIGQLTFPALFGYIFISNLFLALFNLIPAFPLDGGRVFRAALAWFLPYVQATRIAATIGRLAAVLLGLYGLFNAQIFVLFIAVFIYSAAGQEAKFTEIRHSLRGYTVQQVYSPSVYQLTPSHTLQQAYQMLVYGRQTSFPVTLEDRLVGFLTQNDLLEALRTNRAYTWVENVMRRDMPSVSLHTDLFDVQQTMAELQEESLPVVEDNRFLGLITQRHISDLANWLAGRPRRLARSRPV